MWRQLIKLILPPFISVRNIHTASHPLSKRVAASAFQAIDSNALEPEAARCIPRASGHSTTRASRLGNPTLGVVADIIMPQQRASFRRACVMGSRDASCNLRVG